MKYKIGEMVKLNGEKYEVRCILIDNSGIWYSVSGTASYRSVSEDKLSPWVEPTFVVGELVQGKGTEQIGEVKAVSTTADGNVTVLVYGLGFYRWFMSDDLRKAEPVALITRPGATGVHAAIGGYFNREPYWILLPGQMLVATNDSGRPIYPGELIRIRAEKL